MASRQERRAKAKELKKGKKLTDPTEHRDDTDKLVEKFMIGPNADPPSMHQTDLVHYLIAIPDQNYMSRAMLKRTPTKLRGAWSEADFEKAKAALEYWKENDPEFQVFLVKGNVWGFFQPTNQELMRMDFKYGDSRTDSMFENYRKAIIQDERQREEKIRRLKAKEEINRDKKMKAGIQPEDLPNLEEVERQEKSMADDWELRKKADDNLEKGLDSKGRKLMYDINSYDD